MNRAGYRQKKKKNDGTAEYCSTHRSIPQYTTTVLNFEGGHCEIDSCNGHLVDMPTFDGL